jgi:ribosomal protein S3
MIQSQAQDIVTRLMTNTAEVRYGFVSVTVKLHDGRVVEVSYSTTKQTREPKTDSKKD